MHFRLLCSCPPMATGMSDEGNLSWQVISSFTADILKCVRQLLETTVELERPRAAANNKNFKELFPMLDVKKK